MNDDLLDRIITLCDENIDVDRTMTSMREDLGLNFVETFAKEILAEIERDSDCD
jgi:hypothetical protein